MFSNFIFLFCALTTYKIYERWPKTITPAASFHVIFSLGSPPLCKTFSSRWTKSWFSRHLRDYELYSRRKSYMRHEPNKHINMLVSVFELLSALNIFLSITASLGNALIFVSLHKETSLHPPTKLLFRCLVVTDLSVEISGQPLGAVLRLFYTGSYWQNTSTLHQLHQAISFALYGVSVFTTSP